jgi:hypothetical protein
LLCEVIKLVLKERVETFQSDLVISLLGRFNIFDLERARQSLLDRKALIYTDADPCKRLFKLADLAKESKADDAIDLLARAYRGVAACSELMVDMPPACDRDARRVSSVVNMSYQHYGLFAATQITLFPRFGESCELELESRVRARKDSVVLQSRALECPTDDMNGHVYITFDQFVDTRNACEVADSVVVQNDTPCSLQDVCAILRDNAVVQAVRSVISAIAKQSVAGVCASELTSDRECSGLTLVQVILALQILLQYRLIARMIVHGRGAVYLPYDLACSAYGVPPAFVLPSREKYANCGRAIPGVSKPLTPWTCLSGALDEKLGRQVQLQIAASLLKHPGMEEDILCDRVCTGDLPRRAIADVLWALCRAGILKQSFSARQSTSCTLFSEPEQRPSLPDSCILGFVDGLDVASLKRKLSVHYFARGHAVGALLAVNDIANVHLPHDGAISNMTRYYSDAMSMRHATGHA